MQMELLVFGRRTYWRLNVVLRFDGARLGRRTLRPPQTLARPLEHFGAGNLEIHQPGWGDALLPPADHRGRLDVEEARSCGRTA